MPNPRAQALLNLVDEIAPPIGVPPPDPRWHDAIHGVDPNVLIELISMMNSGQGTSAPHRKALREAAIAEVERQSAHAIVQTMTRLDEATNALNNRMYWLAIAGVVLAIAQIVVALIQSPDAGKSPASKGVEATTSSGASGAGNKR